MNDGLLEQLRGNHRRWFSTFYQPAQVGLWMVAATLSHALRHQDPHFAAGLDVDQLLVALQDSTRTIGNPLNSADRHHATLIDGSVKKALYWRYDHRDTVLDREVSHWREAL